MSCDRHVGYFMRGCVPCTHFATLENEALAPFDQQRARIATLESDLAAAKAEVEAAKFVLASPAQAFTQLGIIEDAATLRTERDAAIARAERAERERDGFERGLRVSQQLVHEMRRWKVMAERLKRDLRGEMLAKLEANLADRDATVERLRSECAHMHNAMCRAWRALNEFVPASEGDLVPDGEPEGPRWGAFSKGDDIPIAALAPTPGPVETCSCPRMHLDRCPKSKASRLADADDFEGDAKGEAPK